MNSINKTAVFILVSASLSFCKVSQKSQKVVKIATKEAMLKALQWQETNPIFTKSPADWTNGAYYVGVVKAHEATKDTSYLEALQSMAIRNEWKPWERFFHADDLIISYSYLYLSSLGEPSANLKPTSNFIKDHLYKPYPWKDGLNGSSVEKNELIEKKILWWWCDALFMAPPVITSYSKQVQDESLLKEMNKYYMQAFELLYDKEEHLFSRDTRFLWTGKATDIKEKNGKKVFWSRGNGWVLAGLALILSDMPKNYSNRFFYENLFKEMAQRIKELQPADGLWRTSLLSPDSFDHGEVSGSGFYTFALAWGINNKLLNKAAYEPAVIKGWNAILKCQQLTGKVGWVQDIGANPMPASEDSWQNFGTGAFLLAGTEFLKLQ